MRVRSFGRWLAAFLTAMVLFSETARAQSINATGIIDANGESASLTTGGVSLPGGGWATVAVQVSGTFVGTITLKGSVNAVGYDTVRCMPIGGTTAITEVDAPGHWACPSAGLQVIQAVATAWISGQATVYLRGHPSGGSSGGSSSSFAFTGTAGTPGADVGSIQGIAGMTPVQVSQANPASLNATVDTEFGAAAAAPVGAALGSVPRVVAALTCADDAAGATWSPCAPDIAHGVADAGRPLKIGGYASDTPPSAVSSAQRVNAAYTLKGAAHVRRSDGTSMEVIDPCQGNAKLYVPISQTAGAQLITGTALKKTYLCSIQLTTTTAQNIAVVAGTGSVCATSTVGIMGGATAATGWNLAANGRIEVGVGGFGIAATTVNADNLCLLQSGAGQVSGNLSYVVQ